MMVRITEAELARDVHAVLEKVKQGSEVIIEQDNHRPVAVISSPHRSGRPIIDILREAKQRNSAVTLDEDFGTIWKRSSRAINSPWNPPSWDECSTPAQLSLPSERIRQFPSSSRASLKLLVH